MTVTSTTWQLRVVLAMWVAPLCLATPAGGQHRLRGWSDQATILPSPPLDNLIKRAGEGIERGDWKLAVDSLQRIIDDPQGVLLERSPRLYESARRYAQRTLGSLDAQGLAAYRVLYDSRAQAALDRAVQRHDANALARVVDRYLLSDCGDNAADLLASWMLDAGRPAEVLALFDQIELLCPDSDVPPESIAARRAVAYAMLGQTGSARAALQEASNGLNATTVAMLAALIEALAGQTGDGPLGAHALDAESWPGIGGGGERRGLMPAVTPSLLADVSWRRPLPDARAGDWIRYLETRQAGSDVPAVQAVVAQDRLFVKGVHRCAAVDLESFEPLWESQPDVEGITERYLRRRTWGTFALEHNVVPLKGASLLPAAQRLRRDYVGRSLSVVGDLLLSVERTGQGAYFNGEGVFVQMGGGRVLIQRDAARGAATARRVGSRLVAYDVETGAVRWQRGRNTDPSDPLGAVEFLATPVAVSRELWVPALIRGDLYVVVLDPATGRLARQILLCTPAEGGVKLREALWPAVAGSTVYVPTGQGLLFAVNVADYTPLWAARYRHDDPTSWRQTSPRSRYWLSTPPVVSEPLVLLAPTDSDSLMAFDRITGELRWTVDRADCPWADYIVAADADRVWLAGRQVGCLSAATRRWLWTSEALEPTGRAIVSGSSVYVPTAAGLVALDSGNGHLVGRTPMPPGHDPLGNLLALPGGLISVDTYQVRKYPDLERGYARAVAGQQADPADLAAATRLARMELLRGAPDRALAVLDGARPAESARDGRRAEQATHLRVKALIALGNGAAVPDRAVGYLKRAVAAAARDDDALQAALSLGRQLQRAGRFEDAYRTLWSLGRSEAADQMVTTAPGLERQARAVIAAELAQIEEGLPPEARSRLIHEAAEAVATAVADLPDRVRRSPAADTLRALAQTGAPGGWDQAALIELALWQAGDGKYEPAEQDFNAAIRLDRDPQLTAQALLGLARMYVGRDQLLVLTASECLDRLEREFATILLEAPAGDGRLQPLTVANEVQRLRRMIDPKLTAAHQAALRPGPFRIVRQFAWPGPLEGRQRVLHLRGPDRPEALADRLLVVAGGDVVRAHRAGESPGGGLEWEAELRLLDRLGLDDQFESVISWADVKRCAVADGQTAVICGSYGLHAVGLVTGKQLWGTTQSTEGRSPYDPFGDDRVWAQAGRVACLSETGRLLMLDIRDGATLWQRRVDLPRIGSVRICDGFVLAADPDDTVVHVFELEDGRQVSTLDFRPAGGGPSTEDFVGRCHAHGLLCGPDGSAVVAYDLATGERRWSALGGSMPERLTGLFGVSDDLLGVGGGDGSVRLLEISSGEVMFEQHTLPCGGGVVDGWLDSGMLIVAGVSDPPSGGPGRWALVGIEVAAHGVRWTRDDLAPGPYRPWFFHAVGGIVPAVVELPPDSAGLLAGSSHCGLVLIDTHTGLDTGPPVEPRGAVVGERFNGDLTVRPGCLIVGTTHEILPIRTIPAGEPTP